MQIAISSSSTKPSPAEVDEFARVVGVHLPPDFVGYLLEFGSGSPEDNVFQSDSRLSVSRFLAIDGSEGAVQQIAARYKGRLPKDTIPIAEATGENLVLLRLPEGAVCFWDHEREASDKAQPTGNEACTDLASSFSAFINSLMPMSSKAAENARVLSTKIDPAFAAKFGLKQGAR